MNQLGTIFLNKGHHFIPHENCTLINGYGSGNTKSMDYFLLNEMDDITLGYLNHQMSLNLFQEIICNHDNECMLLSRKGMNLVNQIHYPPSKGPKLDYWL